MTTAFEPRHPAYAERVRDSIASQPLMSRLFPVVIERVEPGLVELSLAVAPDFLQPHGNVHGVLAAGWPGEVVLPDAASNRVYVAMATLRKLGLAPILHTSDDGYRLALDAPIEVHRG